VHGVGAVARGGDHLPEQLGAAISRGENAGGIGAQIFIRLNEARFVHRHQPFEHVRVGQAADKNKSAVGCDFTDLSRPDIFHFHARDEFGAGNFLNGRVPDELDLLFGEGPVLQHARRAQTIAPVNHEDFGGKMRQKQRFLDGGIAAAHHDHRAVAVKRPVAGGAVRNALPRELRLTRNAQAPPHRTRRSNDAQCFVSPVTCRHFPDHRRIGNFSHAGDVFGQDFQAELLRLLFKELHQLEAADAFGDARIIFDHVRDRDLADRSRAFDQQSFQSGTRGVDAGRVAGGTSADNDHIVVRCRQVCVIHEKSPEDLMTDFNQEEALL